MSPALLIAVALSGTPCALRDVETIEAADGRMRVADVVSSGCVGLQQHGDFVVAALPEGVSRVGLSRTALSALIRRRIPAMADAWTGDTETGEVELRRPARARLDAATCFELAEPVPAGAAITARALAPTMCSDGTSRIALDYDRIAGIVRSARAAPAGAYVGPLMRSSEHVIEVGDPLVLRASAGRVVVARDVHAVQSARRGDSLFVRDDHGRIFSAPSDAEPTP